MKTKVLNRNGVDLSVVVEEPDKPTGLVFICHGLGGFKEQVHIRAMAEELLRHGLIVVTYDAANTIGESGGDMQNATLTSYFEDLEDVANWSKNQKWHQAPFMVGGHSLGGAASILYAAKYPDKIKAVIPVSAFTGIDFKETLKSFSPDVEEWKRKGYMLQESHSKPGVYKKIGWDFVEDGQKYDLRTNASKVVCPALLITGSEDQLCSPEQEQKVADRLSGPYELKVIKGMGHNPRSDQDLSQLQNTLSTWLSEQK